MIIDRLARSYKIPREKIIFYESSAGGFAALSLAAHMDGTIAVAINAQTDALAYHVSRQVDLVRQCCFEGWSKERIREAYLERVDMSSKWLGVQKSKAILIQNELDEHHYHVHFMPFWSSLSKSSSGSLKGLSRFGRHISWIYKDERGHVPESIDMAKEIVALAIS